MTESSGKNTGEQNAAIRNVEEIAKLEDEQSREVSRGEQISVALTNTLGTGTFVLVQAAALLLWMGWNVAGPAPARFDPYPFPLLTMIVSMEGVVLALFVLIVQNRMSRQSDRRDHLDLQVSLLAEQEMTMVLRMLDRLSDHLGVSHDAAERDETKELMARTNIYQLMEQLRKKVR